MSADSEAPPVAPARLRDSRAVSPPIVIATLALAALVAVLQPSTPLAILRALLVLVLVPSAVIDIERRIIPNLITGPAAAAAIVLGCALDLDHEPRRLLWAALAGGFLLIAALANPAGMGMGDVKLVAVMGLLLGAPVVVALLVAFLATIVVGIGFAVRRGVRTARKTALPFGPYLALGGIVAALAGNAVLHVYLQSR